MGVKIRKEDSARIHGDHLRYKGRRSVFPPLYLSPPRVPSFSARPPPFYIYVYVDVQVQRICVCTLLLDLYKLHMLYRDKRVYIYIYRCTTRVYVYVYHKHVYCIVLNPLTYSGLSLRETENFPRRALVKFSISLTRNAKSALWNLHLELRSSRFFRAPHLDDALIIFRFSRDRV